MTEETLLKNLTQFAKDVCTEDEYTTCIRIARYAMDYAILFDKDAEEEKTAKNLACVAILYGIFKSYNSPDGCFSDQEMGEIPKDMFKAAQTLFNIYRFPWRNFCANIKTDMIAGSPSARYAWFVQLAIIKDRITHSSFGLLTDESCKNFIKDSMALL